MAERRPRDGGDLVTYREFKDYTDRQLEKEASVAKEIALYREYLAGKLASIKSTQYVQIAILALTLLTVAGDLAYRFMHP